MFVPITKTTPRLPGVYWFLQHKTVIYVGKAKNLKNRLNSYRRLAGIDRKTALMLQTATGVKWQTLDSEIEAVLTEARLIRLYRPRFNLILRDGKAPIYLTITKDRYPRISFSRADGSFGPFTSSRILRQILERLRRIFPYCDRPESGRPCFYYHLNLCSGACIKKISPADYQKNINHIKLFFQNKKKRLMAKLKKEMQALSEKQQYARAKIVKNQIDLLNQFWQTRLMPIELPRLSDDQVMKELTQLFGFPAKRIEMYDISNLSGTNPTGGMAVATDGKIDKSQYRLFNIKSLATPNDPAMMAEMLKRRFNHPEWGKPDVIIVDGAKTQINAVKKAINIPLRSGMLVIGLAKNPDRLIGTAKPLDLTTAAGRLLVQLRDEAHRFGRRQHLRLRSRSLLQDSS